MTLSLNEIHRRLKQADTHPQTLYVVLELYNILTEQQQAIKLMAESIGTLAYSLETITRHQYGIDDKLKKMFRQNEAVSSVPLTDDPEEN